MRKLFWQISSTLDGFMEDPEGSLALTAEIEDKEFKDYASQMLESIDAFIIGRKTYELFVGYWPTASGRDAEVLNSIPKYVVSTTLETVEWNNGKLVGDNVAEEINRLKGQQGRDIAVFGSSTLACSLLDMGLIDECRIMVTPYLLGKGNYTFKKSEVSRELTLTGCHRWSSGTVYLTYAPTRT